MPIRRQPRVSAPASSRKFRIGSLKLGPFEIGPFEVDMPSITPRWLKICIAMAGVGIAAGTGVWAWYEFIGPVRESRHLMQRGDYAMAPVPLASLPKWAAMLPQFRRAERVSGFGLRLARGEHIRTLLPELARLKNDYPDDPDVLVFMGYEAFLVRSSPSEALALFKEAARREPSHVEAHMQAVGRLLDTAFISLARGDVSNARTSVAEARELVRQAVVHSPLSDEVPRYGRQLAELDELEGNDSAAQSRYASLAPVDPLSAYFSATTAWRMPVAPDALQHSEEALDQAIAMVDKQGDNADAEGWLLRTDGTSLIDVHPRPEKLCLLGAARATTRRLLGATEDDGGRPSGALDACHLPDATRMRIREALCVSVATAEGGLAQDAPLRSLLGQLRRTELRCATTILALPHLRPGKQT